MAATPIARSSRYITPGTTKIVFLADGAAVSPGAPTRLEINAGTDISREVRGIEGFAVTASLTEDRELDSDFVGSGRGTRTTEESALSCYADKTGADIRALLQVGESGLLLFMDGGDVSGSLMDIYPIEVASQAKERDMEGGQRAGIRIVVGIPYVPFENVVIPA